MRMTLNHCLMLSLALHGALLAVYRPQPQLSERASTLTVLLVDSDRHEPVTHSAVPAITSTTTGHIPTTTAQARARAARQPTPVRNTTFADTEPSATIVPAVASVPVHLLAPPDLGTSSNPSSTDVAHTTSATDGDHAKTTAWLQTRLLDAFASYFDYPMLARRRGWEGQVKVALRIEHDGRVSHLHLAQSSGYAGLDEAALASARRIEVLNDVATRLHGGYLDMVLPIEYRLLGG